MDVYHARRPMSKRRARPRSVTIIAVIAIISVAVAPLPFALMLPPVLALKSVVGLVMLILKIAMELAMLPGTDTLFVGLVMFFVELIVDVVMALVEPVMLPVVPTLPILGRRGRRKGQKRDRAGCGKYNVTHVILLHERIPK